MLQFRCFSGFLLLLTLFLLLNILFALDMHRLYAFSDIILLFSRFIKFDHKQFNQEQQNNNNKKIHNITT